MTVFKKPKHGECIRNENIVIGHYKMNISIIKNEDGELFFLYGSADQVEVGTVIENEYLSPIRNLLRTDQEQILKEFGSGGVENA